MKLETGNLKFGMVLPFGLSLLASVAFAVPVVVENQVEDQRQEMVGVAGELVFVSDSASFPLVVYDGSTTGGVRLVSADGAVPRVSPTVYDIADEWLGWTCYGGELLTNGSIFLPPDAWLESPLLTGGVLDYDLSGIDAVMANVSSVLFAGSLTNGVQVPYVGRDARLRITAAGVPVMGEDTPGLTIPPFEIRGFADPDMLALDDYVSNFKIISPPKDPEQMARLDTVQAAQDAAFAYTDQEVIKYDADSGKTVRGSIYRLGNGWAFEASGTTNSSMQTLRWGGFPMLDVEISLAPVPIEMAASGGQVVFTASTNGVDTQPVIEYCTDLTAMEWNPVSVISESWPAAVEGAYTVTAEHPAGGAVYFRCMRKTGSRARVDGAPVITTNDLQQLSVVTSVDFAGETVETATVWVYMGQAVPAP